MFFNRLGTAGANASSTCLRLAKLFLAAALFSVVIVWDGTFFPFTEGKYYFFRLCVESALACTACSWSLASRPDDFSDRLQDLLRRPLFLAVCIFTGVFLLSALLAADPRVAFWSTLERGDGAFQMLHYTAFYVLSLLLLRDQKDWRRMLAASVSAALLVIVYGLAAADILPNPEPVLGPAPAHLHLPAPDLLDKGAQTSEPAKTALFADCRFEGSLGNSDYAGTYLLFALFFLSALQFLPQAEGELSNSKGSSSVTVKRFTLSKGAIKDSLLAFVFLLFIVLSDTRGAFLGLVCAAVCAFSYVFFGRPRWRPYLLAMVVVITVIYAAAVSAINKPGVEAFPGSRIFVMDLNDESAKARLRSWHAAWQGFLERPVLGWGPENFSTVFDRHFDTDQFQPGNPLCLTWQDRAHNIYLDYLVETGLLGLVGFLSIFAVLASTLRSTLSQKMAHGPLSHRSMLLHASVIAMLVAYLVQGLFLFDVLSTYISLFFTLSFLTWLLYPSGLKPAQTPNSSAGPMRAGNQQTRCLIAFLITVGLAGTAYYGSVLPMAKSCAYVSMLGKVDSIKSWQEFTATVKEPLDMPSPIGEAELIQDFGWSQAIPIVQTTNQDARISPFLMELIDSYERPLLKDKNRAARCQHLYLMAALNTAAFEGSKQSKYLNAAQNFFLDGLSCSPNRPEFLYGLYEVYKLRGDTVKQSRQARLITSIWANGQPDEDSQLRRLPVRK